MYSPSTSTHLSPSARNSPPSELRHITSNGALTPQKDSNRDRRLSNRASQGLQHRLGSRSPVSIPSSPTSVHSSSSAIFERDIEPISPNPPQQSHPHRTPRGKMSEQLDHSVPSVLDSAAAVLTSTSSPADDQNIAVVAPVSDFGSRSGFGSPSRMSSRSPSPHSALGANRANLLMNLPSPSPSLTLPLPLVPSTSPPASQSPPQRPTVQTQQFPSATSTSGISAGPQPPGAFPVSATPTSSFFPVSSTASSPTTTAREHAPDTFPTPTHTSNDASEVMPPVTGFPLSANLPSATSANSNGLAVSHPPSPRAHTKRLSFMSYTDLLSSTPTSTLPLSSFTTSVSDPPPHLPSVLGVPQMQAGSAGSSIHGDRRSSFYGGERDVREGREGMLLDDVGGEWEREGLGQGLEERLEALMGAGAVGVGKA
ncbi:hypothetical protein EW146_g3928 [Bondarzewia mesenterica]|uniref:Uncharacterized protein n=1 Tax=Bondarzewia mesenterica TaxID=1095465 RepID=A0A4S4LW11_9AGAM|nr:hypothetical protein EW146_g3928 [Bondarzewia mesenterica]